MAKKMTTTTRDVSLLHQLYREGQLTLAPEFQRQSVWPRPAKAYLIDTILHERPIPLLFFARTVDPQTGRPQYAVIDGQQRLRTIFDFLDNRLRLAKRPGSNLAGRRFSDLDPSDQQRIQNYDLVVVDLVGYSELDIKDVFVRMNKYVVKLSPQELRHARERGAFKEFVEAIGQWEFWGAHKTFSAQQQARMRPVEFAAELIILLAEGPQDKKGTIDLYYQKYEASFPDGKELRERLRRFLSWIERAFPELSESRFRGPVDLYGLIGALDLVTNEGTSLSTLKPSPAGAALRLFEQALSRKAPDRQATRYLVAASRQTDNLKPRETRIEVLAKILTKL
jgi:hypothetical protein